MRARAATTPWTEFVEGQAIVVPDGQRRRWLHRIVMAVGRQIDSLDGDVGARSCRGHVAMARIGRNTEGRDGLATIEPGKEVGGEWLGAICHVDELRRGGRALEQIRDDQCDRFSLIGDAVALQRQDCLPRRRIGNGGESGGIQVREDAEHAGTPLGRRRVDRGDRALWNGARNEHGVENAGNRRVRRVARRAGDLGPAIEPADGLAYTSAHATPPAVCKARTTVRLASSILKPF